MNACWKLLDFTSADGVDETGFTNTITADQTVLFAAYKSQKRAIKQGLASYD